MEKRKETREGGRQGRGEKKATASEARIDTQGGVWVMSMGVEIARRVCCLRLRFRFSSVTAPAVCFWCRLAE